MTDAPLAGLTFRALTDAVAASTPAPGGGAIAALTVSVTAALTAMVARYSGDPLVASAEAWRGEAARLADEDGSAYGAFLAALRSPRGDPDREARLAASRSAATDVPLRVAELGLAVAAAAAGLAGTAPTMLHGDAVVAARLAAAAGTGAADLVLENLRGTAGDPRADRATAIRQECAAVVAGLAAGPTAGPSAGPSAGQGADTLSEPAP